MSMTPAIQQKLNQLRRRQQPAPIRSSAAADELAEKLWHFSETEILAPLSEEERHWLATNTAMVTCERGRVFYSPLERNEVVFILKYGRVNLYRLTADGRKLVISTLNAHTIFGEMNLIGQGMYGCYAEAAEDCVICVLSRNDMQALIRKNPEVGLKLLAELGQRLQARETELESIAFRGVPARLADLLLKEADSYGVITGHSHQELAERLGTYRETVSQVLGRFRSEGLIVVEPRRIKITDQDGLEAYTGES
jgi:CRP/FNR family transcriptional regulator, cyclic AMP receptor protein